MFITCKRIKRKVVGEGVKGVGVMKDEVYPVEFFPIFTPLDLSFRDFTPLPYSRVSFVLDVKHHF